MIENNGYDFHSVDKTHSNNKVDDEMIDVMSKLLSVPKKDILMSKKLFSNIRPDIKTCFLKLYKMKERDYITAYMILEYLLVSNKEKIDEIIK